ncbi:MAG: S8 family serine peptidase, partial [Promethearchaeota archaeon]
PSIDSDLLREAVQWAFNQGVTIVAAAGNNGQNGISGSSVESPARYAEVIAVAAVDESNELYSFSARGPLRNRLMKPDIAALGSYNEDGRPVLGTSFAAPIVSAGVSIIISHCITNGWSWTPGMIKASVMNGAAYLPYEEWEVGAGLFDLDTTIQYIDIVQKRNGLPLLFAVAPTISPFSFEQLFVNHTSTMPISIFISGNDTITIRYSGVGSKWLEGPTSIFVNQSGSFDVDLRVESSDSIDDVAASIIFRASGYLQMTMVLEIDAIAALHDVAFDISHTSWSMDSTYGQFRQLYRSLTHAGIAVDELRESDDLTLPVLSNYDAVFVLDPCAWGTVVDGFSYSKVGLFSYTSAELAAYSDYFENGGNLFLVGLSNSSIDHANANNLFSLFNITLVNDQIPSITITVNGISSTKLITDMIPHNITNLVDSFDYNGCSLNFTGTGYEIAWTDYTWADLNGTVHTENRTVMVGLENINEGRLIATGSNFFLDNWALTNMYRSEHDWRFAVQTIYWLLHIY